jgi:hypothetical protein
MRNQEDLLVVHQMKERHGGDMKARTTKAKRAISARFTTLWGWFTAPRFGSAGSGGLEYEPFPQWTAEIPVKVSR